MEVVQMKKTTFYTAVTLKKVTSSARTPRPKQKLGHLPVTAGQPMGPPV
jgi:hypothetical protein